VTLPEKLETISIAEHASRLSEPFTMIDLVQVDDLVLSIYLCQGTMPLHRHLDQDELFLVYSGTISLESEWGNAILRPGELSVAPKGVGHRSSSLLRSLVLLLQPRLMVNRRNGDRRLLALKDKGRLEKVSIPAMGRQIVTPFKPVIVTHLDTFAVHVMVCDGTGPRWRTDRQATLIFCYDGQLDLDSELGGISLQNGELVVVPRGIAYQLSSPGRAVAVGVRRHQQPGLLLPD
jgi:homogentisate 1,2-dioxygenase